MERDASCINALQIRTSATQENTNRDIDDYAKCFEKVFILKIPNKMIIKTHFGNKIKYSDIGIFKYKIISK